VAELPTGTYRLQLRPEFGFAEAGRLAGHLADLGVSHVYLSPILQAAPGSTHGYDVVDHSRVSADLGGEDGFRAMAARFRRAGLGIVVDVVPNHMAVPNKQWDSVLELGADSPYAHWFDIEGERPVPPGEGVPNYRRFFDISGLIALRVEDPDVFAATHEVLFRLADDGLVDGLRIDHPDGLSDPRGYLRRLADRLPDAWIVVEKILTGPEILPADWPCAGTTGYDALGRVDRLFLDPAAEGPLTATYSAVCSGAAESFEKVAEQARAFVADSSLKPERDRLLRVLGGALHYDEATLGRVLDEFLVAFPVYRSYLVPGEPPSEQDREVIGRALHEAKSRLPAQLRPMLSAVGELVLAGKPAELTVRFQQTTSPLAAKGVEDTAFYRWTRFIALNEVGGEPADFGCDPAEFHEQAARVAREQRGTMTTLSTHDTKREEDVRARLAVLAELPDEWAETVARWRAGGTPLEPELEYLLWQTLAGAWPLTLERTTAYLVKAMREQKSKTSWTDPDEAYESAVTGYVQELFADAARQDDIAAFAARLAPYGRVNSLGQKLVQLTMPGVPDVYQGCELVGLSLVDPDNRRPVDHSRSADLLTRLDAENPPRDLDEEKLLVTSRALRLRRMRPTWFTGGYEPLTAAGPAAAHCVAFRRGRAVTVATRLPYGLEQSGGWSGTTLGVRGRRWENVLTGTRHEGPDLALADLLTDLPVALLVQEDDPPQ